MITQPLFDSFTSYTQLTLLKKIETSQVETKPSLVSIDGDQESCKRIMHVVRTVRVGTPVRHAERSVGKSRRISKHHGAKTRHDKHERSSSRHLRLAQV